MQDFYAQKQVLVTGASGFVGSHLTDRLLELGAHVTGVDNFTTGRKQNLSQAEQHENFTFIEADVSQPTAAYLPSDTSFDVILHFASPASPPRYQERPIETYLVNTMGTHHLATYIKDHAPHARMVYASSSEVYGDPEVHPQPESYWGNVNPNGPRACYDEGKRMGETVCGVFHRDFGVDARMVRIFNTYGPRLDPDDGRVISNFLKQALSGQPLTIYGDGSQTRSYCYVSDLVEVILRFAAKDGAAGETINIGNPDEHTVLETAEIIRSATHTSQEYEYSDLPTDDPTRRQPDISKAMALLDWTPVVSFEDGLAKTIEYYRESEL